MAETQVASGSARVDWVHENLREVEEGMMQVQLRAEGSRGIGVDLILDNRAVRRALNLPPALIEFAHRERIAGTIFGADPVHELSEIADLIKRVPDGKLEFALGSTRGQDDLHVYQMLLGGRQIDCVRDRRNWLRGR